MIRATITIALGFWALSAAAGVRVLEQVEQPYELALGTVNMPTDPTGQVSFQACATCTYEYHSVYSGTKYFVNGRELAFKDFLPAVASLRSTSGGSTALVGLFVDTASQRVTRISVRQGTK